MSAPSGPAMSVIPKPPSDLEGLKSQFARARVERDGGGRVEHGAGQVVDLVAGGEDVPDGHQLGVEAPCEDPRLGVPRQARQRAAVVPRQGKARPGKARGKEKARKSVSVARNATAHSLPPSLPRPGPIDRPID